MDHRLRRVPAWLWLILISGALRLVNLGQESLWYDESFTAWLARLNLPQMFVAIRGDVHPPLWYFLEWVNIRLFGDSEFALRLPSAILGIAIVLLIWRIALTIGFERSTAFLAGLLTAVLPSALYYSQEARMYSLLACFVLLGVWGVIEVRWRYVLIACIGSMYTQNLGVFYAAVLIAAY